jgi:hypothetical protein
LAYNPYFGDVLPYIGLFQAAKMISGTPFDCVLDI